MTDNGDLSDAGITRQLMIEELEAQNSYEEKAKATKDKDAKKVYLDIKREEAVHEGELRELLERQDRTSEEDDEEGEEEVEEKIGKSIPSFQSLFGQRRNEVISKSMGIPISSFTKADDEKKMSARDYADKVKGMEDPKGTVTEEKTTSTRPIIGGDVAFTANDAISATALWKREFAKNHIIQRMLKNFDADAILNNLKENKNLRIGFQQLHRDHALDPALSGNDGRTPTTSPAANATAGDLKFNTGGSEELFKGRIFRYLKAKDFSRRTHKMMPQLVRVQKKIENGQPVFYYDFWANRDNIPDAFYQQFLKTNEDGKVDDSKAKAIYAKYHEGTQNHPSTEGVRYDERSVMPSGGQDLPTDYSRASGANKRVLKKKVRVRGTIPPELVAKMVDVSKAGKGGINGDGPFYLRVKGGDGRYRPFIKSFFPYSMSQSGKDYAWLTSLFPDYNDAITRLMHDAESVPMYMDLPERSRREVIEEAVFASALNGSDISVPGLPEYPRLLTVQQKEDERDFNNKAAMIIRDSFIKEMNSRGVHVEIDPIRETVRSEASLSPEMGKELQDAYDAYRAKKLSLLKMYDTGDVDDPVVSEIVNLRADLENNRASYLENIEDAMEKYSNGMSSAILSYQTDFWDNMCKQNGITNDNFKNGAWVGNDGRTLMINYGGTKVTLDAKGVEAINVDLKDKALDRYAQTEPKAFMDAAKYIEYHIDRTIDESTEKYNAEHPGSEITTGMYKLIFPGVVESIKSDLWNTFTRLTPEEKAEEIGIIDRYNEEQTRMADEEAAEKKIAKDKWWEENVLQRMRRYNTWEEGRRLGDVMDKAKARVNSLYYGVGKRVGAEGGRHKKDDISYIERYGDHTGHGKLSDDEIARRDAERNAYNSKYDAAVNAGKKVFEGMYDPNRNRNVELTQKYGAEKEAAQKHLNEVGQDILKNRDAELKAIADLIKRLRGAAKKPESISDEDKDMIASLLGHEPTIPATEEFAEMKWADEAFNNFGVKGIVSDLQKLLNNKLREYEDYRDADDAFRHAQSIHQKSLNALNATNGSDDAVLNYMRYVLQRLESSRPEDIPNLNFTIRDANGTETFNAIDVANEIVDYYLAASDEDKGRPFGRYESAMNPERRHIDLRSYPLEDIKGLLSQAIDGIQEELADPMNSFTYDDEYDETLGEFGGLSPVYHELERPQSMPMMMSRIAPKFTRLVNKAKGVNGKLDDPFFSFGDANVNLSRQTPMDASKGIGMNKIDYDKEKANSAIVQGYLNDKAAPSDLDANIISAIKSYVEAGTPIYHWNPKETLDKYKKLYIMSQRSPDKERRVAAKVALEKWFDLVGERANVHYDHEGYDDWWRKASPENEQLYQRYLDIEHGRNFDSEESVPKFGAYTPIVNGKETSYTDIVKKEIGEDIENAKIHVWQSLAPSERQRLTQKFSINFDGQTPTNMHMKFRNEKGEPFRTYAEVAEQQQNAARGDAKVQTPDHRHRANKEVVPEVQVGRQEQPEINMGESDEERHARAESTYSPINVSGDISPETQKLIDNEKLEQRSDQVIEDQKKKEQRAEEKKEREEGQKSKDKGPRVTEHHNADEGKVTLKDARKVRAKQKAEDAKNKSKDKSKAGGEEVREIGMGTKKSIPDFRDMFNSRRNNVIRKALGR